MRSRRTGSLYARCIASSRVRLLRWLLPAAAVLALGAVLAVYARERHGASADAGVAQLPSAFGWLPTPGVVPTAPPDSDAGGPALGAPCDVDDDCAEGLSCCVGTCTDTESDRLSCGACDRPCGEAIDCYHGSCLESCDTAPCPAGYTCIDLDYCVRASCTGIADDESCAIDDHHTGSCCDSACVDTEQSSSHCGGCETACGRDQFCTDGECQANVDCADAGGAACPLRPDHNGLCCDDRCVDEDRDLTNCGTCGRGCARGEVCSAGECAVARCEGVPADETCAGADGGANGACCNGRCLPIASYLRDADNCGACRAHCPSGAACVQGSCADPDSGQPFGCQRSGCRADEVCMTDGVCMRKGCNGVDDNTPCAEAPDLDGVCCGQVCTDVSQSQSSCGRCGQSCDGGELCDDAVCKPFAGCGTEGQEVCPLSGALNGVCCGSACIDTNTDPGNCGSCGQACLAGRTCERGLCRTADCAQAQTGEYCLAPNSAAAECCHGRCMTELSFETDSANCGDCGLACPAGLPCTEGSCTDPDSGGAFSCSETGCPQGQACISGDHCVPTSCSTSEDGLKCAGADPNVMAVCCGQQCVDARLDPLNCGSCGNACGSGQFCAFGACVGFSGCDAGGTPCPVGPQRIGLCCGNGCTDIAKDPQNCGHCGVACPPGIACVDFDCQTPPGEDEPGE